MTIHFNLCKLIKAKKNIYIFSHFHSSQKNHSATRCSHRSTRLKIRGKGLLRFLPKLEGGSVLIEQSCQGGFLIIGYFSFLLIVFWKFAYFIPPSPPCVHFGCSWKRNRKKKKKSQLPACLATPLNYCKLLFMHNGSISLEYLLAKNSFFFLFISFRSLQNGSQSVSFSYSK